jgi:hypothetical protein
MSHEIPKPPAREEVEHTPEVRLFNVEAMRDEQIIVLHRALTMAGEFIEREGGIVDTSGGSDEMNPSGGG